MADETKNEVVAVESGDNVKEAILDIMAKALNENGITNTGDVIAIIGKTFNLWGEKLENPESTEVGNLNYLDGGQLAKLYKNARSLAKSDLFPDTFKNKPENLMIAMDLAQRSGYPLSLIVQNLYVVQGKPAWSGQFCMTAVLGCGLFENVRFVWNTEKKTATGETDKFANTYGCCLVATDRRTGNEVKGTTVDWQMVHNFGWDKKNGSMWQKMPEQMFQYRAASYFARIFCPQILFGIQTKEEVIDTYGEDVNGEIETITVEVENVKGELK